MSRLQANVPATEHSFSELPPGYLYLDTDFIVNYLFANQPHHRRVEGFALRIYEHGATQIHVSSLTWIEFLRAITRQSFRDNLEPDVIERFSLSDWTHTQVRASYLDAQLGFLQQFLDQFTWAEVPLTPEVRRAASQYVKEYNLQPQDAVHLASVALSGIVDLASFDGRFRGIDELHLWNDEIHSRPA